MPSVADRVAETTATTGTGTVTLAGAKTGYQTFTTAFADGTKVYYCITDNTDFEVGVGTFTTAGTTLSRDSIFTSSNAGSAVNWGAGTKDVFCTAPMQSVVGAPRFQNKTGAYTVVAGDNGAIINCTSGTFTVALDAAATLGAGFNCWIWNTSTTSTDAITIDPNGSETIDGRSTLVLRRGEGTQIVCDGTNWQTGDKKTMRGYAENILATTTRASASGDRAVAVGSAATASGQYSLALGYFPTASSQYSTAIGASSNGQAAIAQTGAGAIAIGAGRSEGSDSFCAAIRDTNYGASSTSSIAIGFRTTSSNSYSTALGYLVSSSGISSVAIGNNTSSSGSTSVAIGYYSQSTAEYSFALGAQASSTIKRKFAYSSHSISGTAGHTQTGMLVLCRATTDATPTVLTANNQAPATDNQVILPNNSAYAFSGIIVARQQASGGTASAAWKIEGLIRREANAASTVLVASTVTAIDNTPGWTLALSADTTNGGLKIEATGAAATNIRWVATVQTSEVTYA